MEAAARRGAARGDAASKSCKSKGALGGDRSGVLELRTVCVIACHGAADGLGRPARQARMLRVPSMRRASGEGVAGAGWNRPRLAASRRVVRRSAGCATALLVPLLWARDQPGPRAREAGTESVHEGGAHEKGGVAKHGLWEYTTRKRGR